MRRKPSALFLAILATGALGTGPIAGTAAAVEVTLAPTLCGHDEREEGAGACPQETVFKAGVPGAELHLKIGGEAWGCDSEWATSLEFDLGGLPMGAEVYIATLVVRKTGYSDDSEGFTYLGAYAYDATGSEVLLARDDLTPETALDIAYPSAANTNLRSTSRQPCRPGSTPARPRQLLLAPVSEIGYEDWISVGGCGYALPPRLVIVHEGAVADESTSWSDLKANYR